MPQHPLRMAGPLQPSGALLAKPARNGRPGRTIAEHTLDVFEAFRALFGTPERPTELARRWARFFRLGDPASFIANGAVSAFCHDWGKANDGFQVMLVSGRTQLLRHEVISALILVHPSLWAWLDRRAGIDPA